MRRLGIIVGSIRRDSLNARLAKAVMRLAEGRLRCENVRIDNLPLFNQDDENDPAPAVVAFKAQLAEVDAVLFVTPEHNRSIPAALKNAIDWGSRPRGTSVWTGKLAAIIGTSPGSIGTAVAQTHLRTIIGGHVSAILGSPEVYIVFKEGLIDEDGHIGVDSTRSFLQGYVERLAELTEKMAPG